MVAKLIEWLVESFFNIPSNQLDDGNRNANYPIQIDRWRHRVAGAIVLIGMIQIGLIAAVGLLFVIAARADDVGDIEARLIAKEIEQVATTLCSAEEGTVDSQIADYMSTLQSQYEDIKGVRYSPPPCEILLKLRQ